MEAGRYFHIRGMLTIETGHVQAEAEAIQRIQGVNPEIDSEAQSLLIFHLWKPQRLPRDFQSDDRIYVVHDWIR
jgi:hypothetical protein